MNYLVKIILTIFVLFMSWHFYNYSYIYSRYWHLIMDNNLSKDKILIKNVNMQKGKEYIYPLNLNSFNLYSVKLYFPFKSVEQGTFGVNYDDFIGKFSIEILYGEKVVHKEIIIRPLCNILFPDVYNSSGKFLHHSKFIKYIELNSFSFPFKGKYNNLKLRVIILEEDPILLKENIDIYLGVSSI